MANPGTNRSARTSPNSPNQITGIVTSKLISAGVSSADATKYAQFLQEIGNYMATDGFLADALSAKDTREGLIRALSANKLLQNGSAMNLTSSSLGFSTVRMLGGFHSWFPFVVSIR